jgi:hypothetical protein
MEDSEISRKHFGAAVEVAGLLTASPGALGEVEERSPARTEISGYSLQRKAPFLGGICLKMNGGVVYLWRAVVRLDAVEFGL